MPLANLNWLALVAAAVSMFVLGGLWYSKALFGKAWMSACGLTEKDLRRGNAAKIFGLSLVFSLGWVINLDMFLIDAKTTTSWGAAAVFLAGFGLVALSIAMIGLFERRTWKHIFINGGYVTIAFVLMGLIIGAWRQ